MNNKIFILFTVLSTFIFMSCPQEAPATKEKNPQVPAKVEKQALEKLTSAVAKEDAKPKDLQKLAEKALQELGTQATVGGSVTLDVDVEGGKKVLSITQKDAPAAEVSKNEYNRYTRRIRKKIP